MPTTDLIQNAILESDGTTFEDLVISVKSRKRPDAFINQIIYLIEPNVTFWGFSASLFDNVWNEQSKSQDESKRKKKNLKIGSKRKIASWNICRNWNLAEEIIYDKVDREEVHVVIAIGTHTSEDPDDRVVGIRFVLSETWKNNLISSQPKLARESTYSGLTRLLQKSRSWECMHHVTTRIRDIRNLLRI